MTTMGKTVDSDNCPSFCPNFPLVNRKGETGRQPSSRLETEEPAVDSGEQRPTELKETVLNFIPNILE